MTFDTQSYNVYKLINMSTKNSGGSSRKKTRDRANRRWKNGKGSNPIERAFNRILNSIRQRNPNI